MKVLGVDIGSVAVKLVLLEDGKVLERAYTRIQSSLKDALDSVLPGFFSRLEATDRVAVTGRGAARIAGDSDFPVINEIFAQAAGALFINRGIRSVIDIGGHDAAYIEFAAESDGDEIRLRDFSTNSRCAAGTGSFLDQQAVRLGVDIEHEFAGMALCAEHVPRIAGRCSVFAKSDMIHLQQIATPDREIIAGLCAALAESFKSDILKGRKPQTPVAFQGGVAANRAMVHFMRKTLALNDEELLVSEELCRFTGALGAAVKGLASGTTVSVADFRLLLNGDNSRNTVAGPGALEPLILPDGAVMVPDGNAVACNGRLFLGIDIGSISTNLVLLDETGALVAKEYLMTAGRPIEAVKEGLHRLHNILPEGVEIAGCGTTGSGRYLIGDLFGADTVKNEITAQARGAVALYPEVDTIFEIGGQDSKYISLKNGMVVDFTMNKACAAGTGSFLEEQAGLMGISVKEQFAEYAFRSEFPSRLGQRCTVFIESDLVRLLGEGESIENLCAGLSYSIVHNYLYRVVEHRPVGDRILFQGGTAFNRAVAAAFSTVLGKTVRVPPHNEVTGALGMAEIVREAWLAEPFTTRFKGLSGENLHYEISTFICQSCSNACEIRSVLPEGAAQPLFYGHRCEKYDHKKRPKGSAALDFSVVRREILQRYLDHQKESSGKLRIGIPLGLGFHETLPFWNRFLTELGAETVFSGPTTRRLVKQGIERTTAETCFPVKVFHGHVAALIQQQPDYIFIPAVVNMELDSSASEHNFNCTLAQSVPFLIKSSFRDSHIRILAPVVHMQGKERDILRELEPLRLALNADRRKFKRAYREAVAHGEAYYRELHNAADAFMERHREHKTVVLVSRPYNGYDPGLNLEISKKLADMGIPSIHLDALHFPEPSGAASWRNMFWRYGQKMLAGLHYLRDKENLLPVFLSNFNCGPDSFILHYAARIMGAKPILFLELDEHSADAGLVTRLEAFWDSAAGGSVTRTQQETAPYRDLTPKKLLGKKVYVPNMCDDAMPIAASFRREGIAAEVLPEPTAENLELGRAVTSGKECYPLLITTGDLLRLGSDPDFQPGEAVFFMPTTNGPCRFGEYARLQSILLDQVGLDGIEIFSPSSGDGYDALKDLSSSFYFNIWKGMVCVDLLTKALLATRPREKEPGSTDRVYQQCLHDLEQALEQRSGAVLEVMHRARERFDSLETVSRELIPIGMVGEIYVRLNRFANGDLIRRLEEKGAEVVLAPFGEWSFYANYLSMKNFQDQGHWWKAFGDRLKNSVQYRIEHRYTAPFAGYGLFEEPHVASVVKTASEHLDMRIRGEAVLSIGKGIDFVERGFAGVINVMPFSCMPGLIVASLVPGIRERYDDVPWLNLAFDESGSGTDSTFLEAFIEQARSYYRTKLKQREAERSI